MVRRGRWKVPWLTTCVEWGVVARRQNADMPYDEKTAVRVRRALADERDLVEKNMMGGLCFMVGGNMCCGVTRSALMVRVGPEAYQQMLTQPHVRPLEFGGRRPTGFVLVDPGGYRTEAALAKWIKRGLDLVSTLPRKTSTERRPSDQQANVRRAD
jgi:hypothetical protein